MSLELYQIVFLLIIGGFVGISMSFVGQTGQGIVMPIVLIITGDVFLAIAVNVLNDVIAAASTSVMYIKKKQFKIRRDIFLLITIAIIVSLLGVFILMSTPLGSIYGWFIPLFITILGSIFILRGFPTAESLKKTVKKLTYKVITQEMKESKPIEFDQLVEKKFEIDDGEIIGLIPSKSRIYYLLSLGFGTFMGFNSGLFGGSSGLIIVLALILIYGYPLKKGVGTALVLSIIVSTFTFVFYQILGFTIKGHLYFNLEISIYLAIGSIIVGILSSVFIQNLSAKIMGRCMGGVIASLGLISFSIYILT